VRVWVWQSKWLHTFFFFLFMNYNICPSRTLPFLYASPFFSVSPDAYRMIEHALIIHWYVVLSICCFILLPFHLWYFEIQVLYKVRGKYRSAAISIKNKILYQHIFLYKLYTNSHIVTISDFGYSIYSSDPTQD
jgi:hypothetical protein